MSSNLLRPKKTHRVRNFFLIVAALFVVIIVIGSLQQAKHPTAPSQSAASSQATTEPSPAPATTPVPAPPAASAEPSPAPATVPAPTSSPVAATTPPEPSPAPIAASPKPSPAPANSSTDTNDKGGSTGKKVEAWAATTTLIKGRLTTPRTAKFNGGAWNVVYLGNNRYRVEASVDSQNSFGAMIRTKFQAIVRDEGDEHQTWVLEDLQTNP